MYSAAFLRKKSCSIAYLCNSCTCSARAEVRRVIPVVLSMRFPISVVNNASREATSVLKCSILCKSDHRRKKDRRKQGSRQRIITVSVHIMFSRSPWSISYTCLLPSLSFRVLTPRLQNTVFEMVFLLSLHWTRRTKLSK